MNGNAVKWYVSVRMVVTGTGIEPEVEASSVFCINHAVKLQLYHLRNLMDVASTS